MGLRDNELLVKHKENGRELKVSTRFYHRNAGAYEVLEGEPGEPPVNKYVAPELPGQVEEKKKPATKKTKEVVETPTPAKAPAAPPPPAAKK